MFDGRQLTAVGHRSIAAPARIARPILRRRQCGKSYRPYIIGTIIVVAAQLLAIAGLLVQRARRRRAEETVIGAGGHDSNELRADSAAGGATDQRAGGVRAGIARDLHDGVCQELAGVSIAVGSLKESSRRDSGRAHAAGVVEDLRARRSACSKGVRRLSHDLHPATLTTARPGDGAAARTASKSKSGIGAQVQFTTEGDFADSTPMSPCVSSESRRSRFETASSTAKRDDSRSRSPDRAIDVELTVTDDGRGFDLEAVRGTGGGLGLVSIEERAHVIGGDVQIITGLGQGTTIHVRAPAGSAVGVAMSRARVLIADDHAFVLEGLVNLLKDKFDVVAAVTDGSLLVDAATRLRPDVDRHGHFDAWVERDRGV